MKRRNQSRRTRTNYWKGIRMDTVVCIQYVSRYKILNIDRFTIQYGNDICTFLHRRQQETRQGLQNSLSTVLNGWTTKDNQDTPIAQVEDSIGRLWITGHLPTWFRMWSFQFGAETFLLGYIFSPLQLGKICDWQAERLHLAQTSSWSQNIKVNDPEVQYKWQYFLDQEERLILINTP